MLHAYFCTANQGCGSDLCMQVGTAITCKPTSGTVCGQLLTAWLPFLSVYLDIVSAELQGHCQRHPVIKGCGVHTPVLCLVHLPDSFWSWHVQQLYNYLLWLVQRLHNYLFVEWTTCSLNKQSLAVNTAVIGC